jgi:Zinc dependent phospholipase C
MNASLRYSILLGRTPAAVLLLLLLFFSPCFPAGAYSLLTHEQLIDLTWKQSIVPLLLSRYPTLTPAQLEHARAYAYGGCVIQDIGYYPFGDASFSNLTHYIRSGDFVVNLFRNADELAFAVGALSHYIGDTVGHSQATNLAVPIEFPKLGKKYGASVNYAEGERQHVQTEFAFDINEIAHHRVAPVHYLRHIGLQVPTRQLALAVYQTYGLEIDFSGTRGRRVNVRGYRFAVRNFIPRIAYAVTLIHRNRDPVDADTPELIALEKEVAIVASENGWDQYRRKAGIGTYSLAGLLIGPLRPCITSWHALLHPQLPALLPGALPLPIRTRTLLLPVPCPQDRVRSRTSRANPAIPAILFLIEILTLALSSNRVAIP